MGYVEPGFEDVVEKLKLMFAPDMIFQIVEVGPMLVTIMNGDNRNTATAILENGKTAEYNLEDRNLASAVTSGHILFDGSSGNDNEDENSFDGGPGSGNHGHKGVPGQIGGSAPKHGGTDARNPKSGKNLTKSYSGRPDIKSVIQAQGFDGLPRVVPKEKFDQAVSKSKFVAQRAYTASSPEILDAYRDQLYNGEWYVECEGGDIYGKGMYSAFSDEGIVDENMESVMRKYSHHGRGYVETFTVDPDAKFINHEEIEKLSEEVSEGWGPFGEKRKQYTIDEVKKASKEIGLTDQEEKFVLDRYFNIEADNHDDLISWYKGLDKEKKSSLNSKCRKLGEIANRIEEHADMFGHMDAGTIAALHGYDGILVDDEKFAVILNRTKVIFLDDSTRADANDNDQITFQVGEDGVTYAIRDNKVIGWVRAEVSKREQNS